LRSTSAIGARRGCDHLCAQVTLRGLLDGPHLVLQSLVLGGETRLFALELVEQTLGAVPCLQCLSALVQRFD
jgi:hypothetical protein